MVKNIITITLGLVIFCSFYAFGATCSKTNDADTRQLLKYITTPILENEANDSELKMREELRISLETLDEITDLKDDAAILAYYNKRETPQIGKWIMEKGGHAWLAPRVLCFSRHYRDIAKHLWRKKLGKSECCDAF